MFAFREKRKAYIIIRQNEKHKEISEVIKLLALMTSKWQRIKEGNRKEWGKKERNHL